MTLPNLPIALYPPDLVSHGYELVSDIIGARPFWRREYVNDVPDRSPSASGEHARRMQAERKAKRKDAYR